MEEKLVSTSNWPEDLDALTASVKHHRLLFENEHVRVLDTFIPPGDKTDLHTHKWPSSLYVLSWSDFVRYDKDDNILLDSRARSLAIEPGGSLWSGPLEPHSLKNVGSTDLHIISVELKRV